LFLHRRQSLLFLPGLVNKTLKYLIGYVVHVTAADVWCINFVQRLSRLWAIIGVLSFILCHWTCPVKVKKMLVVCIWTNGGEVPFCIAQNGDEWFACYCKESTSTFSFFWILELDFMVKNLLKKKHHPIFITVSYCNWHVIYSLVVVHFCLQVSL
jgi:hypothetical protein